MAWWVHSHHSPGELRLTSPCRFSARLLGVFSQVSYIRLTFRSVSGLSTQAAASCRQLGAIHGLFRSPGKCSLTFSFADTSRRAGDQLIQVSMLTFFICWRSFSRDDPSFMLPADGSNSPPFYPAGRQLE